MNIAVLLPSFFPDLHHLALLKHADQAYWFYDEIFSRKSLTHRGLIRNAESAQWLTIPVHPDDKKKPLPEVRILPGDEWIPSFMKTIGMNYRNSVYFDFYEPEIRDDFFTAAASGFLIPAIEHFSNRLFRYLEWNHIPIKIKSRTEMLGIIDETDPTEIWVESRSRYYRKALPHQTEKNVLLPKYRQHFEGFIPDCCILDLLFEYGPESFRVLDEIEVF